MASLFVGESFTDSLVWWVACYSLHIRCWEFVDVMGLGKDYDTNGFGPVLFKLVNATSCYVQEKPPNHKSKH